jgi:hypothetical protein
METEVLLAHAQEPYSLLPLWHVCPIDWVNVESLYITFNSLWMLTIRLFYGDHNVGDTSQFQNSSVKKGGGGVDLLERIM